MSGAMFLLGSPEQRAEKRVSGGRGGERKGKRLGLISKASRAEMECPLVGLTYQTEGGVLERSDWGGLGALEE